MPKRPPKPPSQTWRAFLDNHLGSLASIDFFTVPTATFRVLFVFLVLVHRRPLGHLPFSTAESNHHLLGGPRRYSTR